MKAQAWKVWISEGTFTASRGMFYSIVEIYVPELKLAMNESGFYIWDDKRYKHQSHDPDNLDENWEDHQPQLLREVEFGLGTWETAKRIVSARELEEQFVATLAAPFNDLFDDDAME